MLYKILRPLIFLQEPERAHNRIVKIGQFSSSAHLTDLIKNVFEYENPALNISVLGIDFKNPVGIAAGFDKNGVLPEFVESLGFGFEEIGSITQQKQTGNAKPRIFRAVKDRAIINRTGLDNLGAYSINLNLETRKSTLPIGINIAGNFLDSLSIVQTGDYITLNISCPNVCNGKFFENPDNLDILLKKINYEQKVINDQRPVLVKLSPDLGDYELFKLIEICEYNQIDGYVISNTSQLRENLNTSKQRLFDIGVGGLSGKPIQEKSTSMIRTVYNETKKPIIGVGGIFNAQDAYDKIKAGACLIQVYTGLIYEGPSIAKNIKKGLVKLLETEGFSNIFQAVGSYTV